MTSDLGRPTLLSREDLPGLLVAVLVAEIAGSAPAFVTAGATGTWYADLARPAFTPPDWVFGPVWTLLFALMGTAAYLVFRDGRGRQRWSALLLFGGQFALNIAWTLVFFGLQSPVGGLLVIVVLWAAIVATIGAFHRVRPAAAWLLVPYLGWVSVAAVLNLGIVRLNYRRTGATVSRR